MSATLQHVATRAHAAVAAAAAAVALAAAVQMRVAQGLTPPTIASVPKNSARASGARQLVASAGMLGAASQSASEMSAHLEQRRALQRDPQTPFAPLPSSAAPQLLA